METRYCSRCKSTKPVADFGNHIAKTGGRQSWCRECNREYHREYYETNKASYVIKVSERQRKIAEWLRQRRSTLSCEICGENHPSCLQFHHVNPSEKEINVGLAARNGWSIARLEKEIAKCQVLCANCHFKLHWNEREATSSSG